MRIYAEVLPTTLGRAMYRINDQIRKHAPPEVAFVERVEHADCQILDCIGTGSLAYRYTPWDQTVLLMHCVLTSEQPTSDFWLPLWKKARLVVSYHDLYTFAGTDAFAFHRMPWGVDTTVFYDRGYPQRPYGIFTTGFELAGEAIAESYLAARKAGKPTIHLGEDFRLGPGFEAVNDISDTRLAHYYSATQYVCAMRRGEGFELPGIEGLACGARPIVFDTPGYRAWYEGLALFVPELPPAELTEALIPILQTEPTPVTAQERAILKERFDWQTIIQTFWQQVLR